MSNEQLLLNTTQNPRLAYPSVRNMMPGVAIPVSIAALAVAIGERITWLTPLLTAMIIGMILRNATVNNQVYQEGLNFSTRKLLRTAIAMIGARLSLNTLLGLGYGGFLTAAIPLTLTIIVTLYLGRWLRIAPSTSLLIAAGTSICGASAILTMSTIRKSRDAHVIVAITAISLFGSIMMVLYPVLYQAGWLHLDDLRYAHLVGASVHEIAQVAAAGSINNDILTNALLIKLERVALLIPATLILSFFIARNTDGKKNMTAFPMYLAGFVAMAILNSMSLFTPMMIDVINRSSMFFMTVAMAGFGMQTDFKQLSRVGARPLLLGAVATIFISAISYALVRVL